jgi:NTE family protein
VKLFGHSYRLQMVLTGKTSGLGSPALALVIFAFLCAGPAMAQTANPAHRPKVALVLSGGGALGLAHVGVIQELERIGIRPDMIVGTSMGSVVGGLYASGLDSKSLEAAVKAVDWDHVFSPAPERANLTYRQKAQEVDFPVRMGLAIKNGGLLLPAGLVSDQALLQELRRFVPIKGSVDSFDQLPIPYRAVATDIETGRAVVLDHGEVPMAMRASMAVPGVFAPVNLDGKLLVDGGMAANIPISVARDMGADIVIVVATQSSLLKHDKIGSALDVLGQTVTLLVLANERAQLATLRSDDILITIDAGTLNAGEFTKGAEFIEAGRRSFQSQAQALTKIAAGRDHKVYVQGPQPVSKPIDYVRVENSSRLDDKVLARRLAPLIGRLAETSKIHAALNDVYALGPFERVDYALETDGTKTGLHVRAEDVEPDVGRIRLGLTLSNNGSQGADSTVSMDYRTPALDRYGSEVQIQATFGDHNSLSGEYFKLLEPSQSWFTTTRLGFENRPVSLYSPSGFKLASYDLDYGLAALGAGYQIGRFGELRAQIERGQGRAFLKEGQASIRKFDLNIGRLVATGGIDSFDNPYFPTKGVRLGVRWAEGIKALGDASSYQTASAMAMSTLSTARHSVIAGLSGGAGLQGVTPIDSLYRLGGPFRLSGYRRDELSGDSYALAQLLYRYRLKDGSAHTLGSKIFVGGSLEAGQVWAHRNNIDLKDLKYGASVYVAADTALGPMFLAVSRADDGRQAVYLFIGRPF